MDKRVKNTLNDIHRAFESCLNKKKYTEITIQDILDEAKISRSTFYSHFKTKEDLLNSICESIFHHVFSHSLEEEKSHDFSKSSIFDYKHLITHIFYHIHDERDTIEAVLKSESKDLLLSSMRKELTPFSNIIIDNRFFSSKNCPKELRRSMIIESFIVIIQYWINNNYTETPETLTDYFISIND